MASARERPSLALTLQRRLEAFYRLEPLPPVDDFARAQGEGEREAVFVRDGEGDDVEVAVALPSVGLEPPGTPLNLDTLCQVVEGVSHFIYLAECVRRRRPTTLLELELQAEVDKFVVLAFGPLARAELDTVRAVHASLYERVAFLHDAASEHGERYRLANGLAARLCARFRSPRGHCARSGREVLVRFYREGQQDKIRLARAALRHFARPWLTFERGAYAPGQRSTGGPTPAASRRPARGGGIRA